MKQSRFLNTLAMLIVGGMLFAGCSGKKMSGSDKAKLYYDAGIGYINKGDPHNAIDSLKQAHESDPKNPLILHALGLAYFQLGVPETALVWMQKALADLPDDPEINNNTASIYLTLGQYDKAVAHASKAIADPDYRTPAAAYFNRGMGKLQQNDLAGAESDFRSAIRHEPMYDMPRVELGKIFVRRNQFEDAVQMLSAALKINQNNAEAYLFRGESYWNQGYVSRAETDFNAILKLKNVNPTIKDRAHDWLERIR